MRESSIRGRDDIRRGKIILPNADEGGQPFIDEGEEVEEEEELNIETHIDIFTAPVDSITLYSLCRKRVLKLLKPGHEDEVGCLPIPTRLKDDLKNVRRYYTCSR